MIYKVRDNLRFFDLVKKLPKHEQAYLWFLRSKEEFIPEYNRRIKAMTMP